MNEQELNARAAGQPVMRAQAYTVVVEEAVSRYLDHAGVTNVDAYVNQLIREERDRTQVAGDAESQADAVDATELIANTPDTSGANTRLEEDFHFDKTSTQIGL